jgi:exodeoxyribonuclease X
MIILFDVETTGAGEGAEIIEAAVAEVTMPAGETPYLIALGDVRVQRYKPTKPIDLGALAAHHILEAELTNEPPASTFALPAETKLMIGHNIDFDWKMAGSPPIHRVCTLALARSVWPTLDTYSQGALLYHLLPHHVAREKLVTAHNAETDVRNLFLVLSAICAVLQPKSWRELYRFGEEARIPKFITFGKHKPKPGEAPKPFTELPRSYREWLLKEPEMDPYVKVAVRRSFGMADVE